MLIVVTRALRSAWRGARRLGRWLAQVSAPRPSGDWLDRLTRERQWGPKVEGEIRRLAAAWRDSFCGKCAASPDYPQGRCPDCLRKLADILQPPGNDTPSARLLR
jgi:hypothetical protein